MARLIVFAARRVGPRGQTAVARIVVATRVAKKLAASPHWAGRSREGSQHKTERQNPNPILAGGKAEGDRKSLQKGSDHEYDHEDLEGTRAHEPGLTSMPVNREVLPSFPFPFPNGSCLARVPANASKSASSSDLCRVRKPQAAITLRSGTGTFTGWKTFIHWHWG